jgi:type I restriction enzyme S subunit
MTVRQYEAYKPSGVEWLGDVPSHWVVAPIKYHFRVAGGATPKSDLPEYWEGDIPWFTPVDLSDSGIAVLETSARSISEAGLASCSANLVPAGSVLMSTRAPIGSLGIAKTPATTNQGCKSLVPKGSLSSTFLASTLLVGVDELRIRGKGSTFLELSGDELGSFPVPVPTPPEQRAIAAFLDRETAKIDELVEEQRRLIELLKEKRQAVISHAVTKGLDPTAPMKLSGIEWLGDVPAHWEVTGVKRYCLAITDGAHVSPETENGVHCFVSTKDLSDAGIDFEECLRTSDVSYAYLVRTGCKPNVGDLLFSKDGTIGRTAVVNGDRDFVVASSLVIIRPDRELLYVDFLHFLCQSVFIKSQVESFVKGAGLPRLSIQNLLRVIGVFPPIEEQVQIATALSSAAQGFEKLSAVAETAITLLQERRAALISAAVTGKIDVRGLVDQAEAA